MNKKVIPGKPPTKNQQLVLEYLQEFIGKNHYSPTYSEIAEHFEWSGGNAAVGHVQLLAKRGLITLQKGKARTIRIPEPVGAE